MMSPGEIADEHRYQRDAATVSWMRKVAEACGYAIATHGSRSEKDLDLIAVPWVKEAFAPMQLVNAFLEKSFDDQRDAPKLLHRGERISETRYGEIKSNKPHGRMAVILIREEDHRLIDLSIVARVATAASPPLRAEDFPSKRQHPLCASCTIKNSCPQLADFVPNNSTKVCFFNNPAISRPKEYAMFESKKAPAPVVEVGVVKTAMNVRKAQTCGTCGNARNNPGMGGPGDGFLECNANVLCRFQTEHTAICDHYNAAHGPQAMSR